MPNAFLKKIASKEGASMESLEKFWKEAKSAASEGGKTESDPQFFGLVTKIFKAKINKHLNITTESAMHFMDFLRIEKFIMEVGPDKGEKPDDDDAIKQVKDTDAEPIVKMGIKNPPGFKGTRGLPVKKKLKGSLA